jgi:large subunit ribosomal protein L7/L12
MSAKYYKEVIMSLADRAGLTNIEKQLAANHPSKYLKYGQIRPMYKIVLKFCGDKKVGVIKEIRHYTGLGLKEAKELSDNAPCVLQETDDIEHARGFVQGLVAYGAGAEMSLI